MQFKKVPSENELPNPSITSLAMDSTGFLWIGTQHGLCSYDGVSYTKFYHQPNSPSIPSNMVLGLIALNRGKLLVATNRGIGMLNTVTSTWQLSPINKDAKGEEGNYSIFHDGRDTILAATGQSIYNLDTNLNIRYKLQLPNGPSGQPLSFVKVEKILNSTHGLLVQLCTGPEKWAYYWVRGKQLVPVHGNMPLEQFLTRDHLFKDAVWTDKEGFFGIRLLADSLFHFSVNGQLRSTYPINGTKANQFYYGTGIIGQNDSFLLCRSASGGLIAIKKAAQAGKLHPVGETFLAGKSISYSLFDKRGNLWAGTTQGLFKADANTCRLSIGSIPKKASLTEQSGVVEDVSFTGNGIFLTTSGNGVYYSNSVSNKWKNIVWPTVSKKRCNDTWNVRQQSTDTVWIGTQAGMQWYNTANGSMGSKHFGKGYERMDSVPITTQFVDSENLLWMGLGKGTGLAAYDMAGHKMAYYLRSGAQGSFPISYVLCIAEDAAGNLWMNNFDASRIVRWNRKTRQFSIYSLKGQLPNIAGIISLAADRLGNVWFATTDGLVQLEIASMKVRRLPLSDDQYTTYDASSLDVGNDNTVWLATTRGIFFYRDGRLMKHIPTAPFNDSLITSINCSRTSNQVFFTTAHSINSFDAGFKEQGGNRLQVFIKALSNNGTELSITSNNLNLPYNYQSLTIGYAALDLEDGFSNNYYYSINGAAWLALGHQRQLNLINLKSGKYEIRIKASDAMGNESINHATLQLSIGYPFWQTWWFIALACLFVAGISYLFYSSRIRRFRQLQEVKDSIARNLHDDIGASLTNINILAGLGASHLNEPEKAAGFLKKVEEEVNNSAESLSDIVWSIKRGNDSLNGLLVRMRRFAMGLFDNNSSRLSISIHEVVTDQKVAMAQVHDVYMVFKEYMANIAKHAKATQVSVDVKVERNILYMHITDDGIGFDTSRPHKGNGLINIQKRTNEWNGTARIESKEGAGTSFHFQMQLQAQ